MKKNRLALELVIPVLRKPRRTGQPQRGASINKKLKRPGHSRLSTTSITRTRQGWGSTRFFLRYSDVGPISTSGPSLVLHSANELGMTIIEPQLSTNEIVGQECPPRTVFAVYCQYGSLRFASGFSPVANPIQHYSFPRRPRCQLRPLWSVKVRLQKRKHPIPRNFCCK